MAAIDKITGSLLGLAIGDALGAPVEGMKAGHILQTAGEISDYADSRLIWPEKPSHWRQPGLYMAATQQALAITDVLGDYGQADLEAIADLWTRLLRAGAARPTGAFRAPGVAFLRAVRAMADGVKPIEAAIPSAGNGAAIRIAPVALFYRDDENAIIEATIKFSLATHSDPRAIAAAASMAFAIAQLLSIDEPLKPAAAAELARSLKDFTRRAEIQLQDNQFKNLDKEARVAYAHAMSDALDALPPIVRESNHDLARQTIIKEANRRGPAQPITDASVGFAPASVLAALYYALSAPTFFKGLTDAVNAGRDTTSVGAMTGALIGARFGSIVIPEEWTLKLINADQIRLRGQYLANREVDYMTRDDYVDMETALTLEEERFFDDDLKKYRKEQAGSEQKKQKSKPKHQAATLEDLGFAPPPETWVSLEELTPEEKRREKERRARRRIDWKEERREKQRHGNINHDTDTTD